MKMRRSDLLYIDDAHIIVAAIILGLLHSLHLKEREIILFEIISTVTKLHILFQIQFGQTTNLIILKNELLLKFLKYVKSLKFKQSYVECFVYQNTADMKWIRDKQTRNCMVNEVESFKYRGDNIPHII